jgi:hypothetical protein
MKTNFYSNISNEKNYENEKKSLKTKKSCRWIFPQFWLIDADTTTFETRFWKMFKNDFLRKQVLEMIFLPRQNGWIMAREYDSIPVKIISHF